MKKFFKILWVKFKYRVLYRLFPKWYEKRVMEFVVNSGLTITPGKAPKIAFSYEKDGFVIINRSQRRRLEKRKR